MGRLADKSCGTARRSRNSRGLCLPPTAASSGANFERVVLDESRGAKRPSRERARARPHDPAPSDRFSSRETRAVVATHRTRRTLERLVSADDTRRGTWEASYLPYPFRIFSYLSVSSARGTRAPEGHGVVAGQVLVFDGADLRLQRLENQVARRLHLLRVRVVWEPEDNGAPPQRFRGGLARAVEARCRSTRIRAHTVRSQSRNTINITRSICVAAESQSERKTRAREKHTKREFGRTGADFRKRHLTSDPRLVTTLFDTF